MSESKVIFRKDDLVWAKVKGYQWWPATVSKLNYANFQT